MSTQDKHQSLGNLFPLLHALADDPRVIHFKKVDPGQALEQLARASSIADIHVNCPNCGKEQKREGSTFTCECLKE